MSSDCQRIHAVRGGSKAGVSRGRREPEGTWRSRRRYCALDIPGATLVERMENDAHKGGVETLIGRNADVRVESFMLSGNAHSIQRLTRTIKRGGVASSRIQIKAY